MGDPEAPIFIYKKPKRASDLPWAGTLVKHNANENQDLRQ